MGPSPQGLKPPKPSLVQSHLLRWQRQPAQHSARHSHGYDQPNQSPSKLARQRTVPPLPLAQPQPVPQPRLARPRPARACGPQPAPRPLLDPHGPEPDLLRPLQPVHRSAPSPAPRVQTEHRVQLSSRPRRHRRRLGLWRRRQPAPTPTTPELPPRQHLLGQNSARRARAQNAPSPAQFLYGL